MPFFVANSVEGELNTFALDESQRLKIGRKLEAGEYSDADVELNISTASQNHALAWHDGSHFVIRDIGSTNGLFINGKRIDSQALCYGDKLSFGDPQKTHFTFSKDRSVADSVESTYRFELPLSSPIRIGRTSINDIVLSNEPVASSSHAELVHIKGAYWVQDTKSTNGTWVNGERIKRKKVESDDVIFIGSSLIRVVNDQQSLTVSVSKWSNSIHLECVSVNKVVSKDLKILSDINLSISPGEFVGILGPSGAGKSTLLQALNGFSPPTSGTVLMNELALFKSYGLCKNMIGYVPQDDVVYQDMSVKETLFYSAKLRLPNDQSNSEINLLVDHVLRSLRLDHVADSTVESLSGGQRKRVSVGTELLTNPALLFLDEPTSGLDPSTEEKLMRHLREMSANGTTILITTHILYNLDLLDKVIFLARGRIVFYGTPAEALEFFTIDGRAIERPMQIFDLLEGEIAADSKQGEALSADMRPEISKLYADQYVHSSFFDKYIKQTFSNLANKLTKVAQGEALASIETQQHTKLLENPLPPKSMRLERFLPDFRELRVLVKRHFTLKCAALKKMQIYLAVPLILGLITLSMTNAGFPDVSDLNNSQKTIQQQVESGQAGSIDYQLKLLLSPNGASDSRSGTQLVYQLRHETVANLPISLSVLLILTMTAIFCGTLSACLELSTEKNIFLRERMAGQKTINYLLSKIPFLFVLTFLQIVVLVVICSFDSNLRELNLLSLIVSLVMISWASVALGLLVSALDPSDGQFSVVIAIAVILPQMILSGALGPDYYVGMPSLTQSIANLFPAKWGMELVLSSAFDGKDSVSWVKGFVRNSMGLNFDAAVYFRGFLVYLALIAAYLGSAFYLLERRSLLG